MNNWSSAAHRPFQGNVSPVVYGLQVFVLLFGVFVTAVSGVYALRFAMGSFELRVPIVVSMCSETIGCAMVTTFAAFSVLHMSNDFGLMFGVVLRLLILVPALVSTWMIHVHAKQYEAAQQKISLVDEFLAIHRHCPSEDLNKLGLLVFEEMERRLDGSEGAPGIKESDSHP